MASTTKPIFLDETGKEIVEELKKIAAGTGGNVEIDDDTIKKNANDQLYANIPVKSISRNNTALTPDASGNVNIEVPSVPIKAISRNNTDLTPDSNGKVNIEVPTVPVKSVSGNNTAITPDASGNVNITPSSIGLGDVGNFKAVSTVASQGLNDTEKSNARNNIGLGGAATKSVSDSSSAEALGTGTNLVTERDVYNGLPKFNDAHTYTSNTNYYVPTAKGTSGQVLKSNGNSTPTWGDVDRGYNVIKRTITTSATSPIELTKQTGTDTECLSNTAMYDYYTDPFNGLNITNMTYDTTTNKLSVYFDVPSESVQLCIQVSET